MKRILLSALGALILSPSSFAIIDANNNGLSELWEKQYNNGELYPETGSASEGSSYAYSHRNTIIAEMIPCTTFAAGRNAFNDPETSIPAERNIDMNAIMKTDPNQWPESGANEGPTFDDHGNPITNRPWLHSDIREKAFTHTWKVYEKFVELGDLKQQP